MFVISTSLASLKVGLNGYRFNWSLQVYTLERAVTKPNEPVIYYLHDGAKRRFVL